MINSYFVVTNSSQILHSVGCSMIEFPTMIHYSDIQFSWNFGLSIEKYPVRESGMPI